MQDGWPALQLAMLVGHPPIDKPCSNQQHLDHVYRTSKVQEARPFALGKLLLEMPANLAGTQTL